MNYAIKTLVAATATAVSMSSALASPVRVSGPAGNVVSMDYNGCTYVATNHSSARVRVHLGSSLLAYVNPANRGPSTASPDLPARLLH